MTSSRSPLTSMSSCFPPFWPRTGEAVTSRHLRQRLTEINAEKRRHFRHPTKRRSSSPKPLAAADLSAAFVASNTFPRPPSPRFVIVLSPQLAAGDSFASSGPTNQIRVKMYAKNADSESDWLPWTIGVGCGRAEATANHAHERNRPESLRRILCRRLTGLM